MIVALLVFILIALVYLTDQVRRLVGALDRIAWITQVISANLARILDR